MRKVLVRVPLRADLAGGTLDLWPLYLFHPGACTINVAISLHAECEITRAPDDSTIELLLTDLPYERRYQSLPELVEDPKAALIARALEHFKLNGIRIVTRTDAPRGSGLGGSSALAIALVRALSEFAGSPVQGDALIELVRDLETRLLRIPAGIQDYYPPVYGGLMSLHLEPGKIARHPLSLPIAELTRHFLLHYTGVSHFSGTNNWEIYKRHIDGDRSIIEGLAKIAASASELEHALETHNLRAAGKALRKEWENRKELIRGISTREIEQAIDVARKAGAWGGKVCGAGGGGSVIFLVPVKKKEAVRAALSTVPGQTLNVVPVSYGLNIEVDEEAAPTLAFPARRVSARKPGAYEQLFEIGRQGGDYRPFILADGRITYDEPRGGIHTVVECSLLAPVALHAERVEWERAAEVRPQELRLSAVPDQGKEPPTTDETALLNAASEGEDTLRQYLADRGRLSLLHNQSFGLWSEPGESREAFLNRCLEQAERLLQEESERLESTYRRRMDQMREKAERELREQEKNMPAELQTQPEELGIAWGQALYNITSGKQVSSVGSSQSRSQADTMEAIAQLQRQWEREREQKQEELESRARAIEEVVLAPNPRHIEIVRYIIVWAPQQTATAASRTVRD